MSAEAQINIQDIVAEFQSQFPKEFTIAVQAVRIRQLEEAANQAPEAADPEG